MPLRERAARGVSSRRHGRSGSCSCSSARSLSRMRSFQVQEASASARTCKFSLHTIPSAPFEMIERALNPTFDYQGASRAACPPRTFLQLGLFLLRRLAGTAVAVAYSATGPSFHSHYACSYRHRCAHRSAHKVCTARACSSTCACARTDLERWDMDCPLWHQQRGAR